jgi:hypothetical protein
MIKIIISILLLICLLDMPYGYFQFVRFSSIVAFAYLAFSANEEGRQSEVIIFVLLAFLFQPFIKISLGRELWNIVDVIVSAGLIFSLVKNRFKK